MSKSCAFCENTRGITKEHVFPKCLIERLSSYTARYSSKPHKWFEADLTVRDVCTKCNNGILSGLDAYICEAHDTYFRNFAREGDVVEFRYQYQLLTRWLLKTSYNSARSSGQDDLVAKSYVPYIMGLHDEPENVSFLVKLVKPTGMLETSGGATRTYEMLPAGCHVGRLQFNDRFDWSLTRFVSINSYYFFLVFTPDPYAFTTQNEIDEYIRTMDAHLIRPETDVMSLETSGWDAFGLYSTRSSFEEGVLRKYEHTKRSKR